MWCSYEINKNAYAMTHMRIHGKFEIEFYLESTTIKRNNVCDEPGEENKTSSLYCILLNYNYFSKFVFKFKNYNMHSIWTIVWKMSSRMMNSRFFSGITLVSIKRDRKHNFPGNFRYYDHFCVSLLNNEHFWHFHKNIRFILNSF